jgi:DNA-directed RNA polymerase subunit RPC12/RpoP
MSATCSRSKKTFTYLRNEDGQFVCPQCGVIKNRQNSMHYHMKKHTENAGHACAVCSKRFLQKQTLDLHLRSKHPERVSSASSTTTSTASTAASDSDTLSSSSSEDGKPYHCPMDSCEFKALTKGNCIIHCLRAHFQKEIRPLLTVSAETKHSHCAVCNRTFSSSTSFYYHCKDCIFPTLEETEKKRALQGIL